MSDPELDAIRRARLAQLRESAPPSGAYTDILSMSNFPGDGAPELPHAGKAPSGAGDAEHEEQRAQQEEMKRQMLSQILDPDARERLSRISLVKPQKASAVQDILLQMARSGQVRQRVSEAQLISLLDQIDQSSASDGPGKITVARKKNPADDDDWGI
ncbi:hypothetical protein MSPP1_000007 [Malassezia sp. CBS 17886]|nr:hypothetical protein MSPP1_000007 [Malassezia sp. CBS 17886]